MKQTFTTTILKDIEKNATGIRVPVEVIAALGIQKRPPVKVTLSGYTYRSTVAAYGDVFMLPLSAANREAAGVHPGDTVEITLELDTEPRTVDVPGDLAAALQASGAKPVFETLSYSMRKEYVRQVESAKAQATRERRISGIISQLNGS